jgi:GNAT superfamily N-acetyltransferase
MRALEKHFQLPRPFHAADLPLVLRREGYRVTLRLLRPDDAALLIAFFESHTQETVRQRYGYLLAEMSPARAATLVGVDQSREAALGVFEDAHASAPLVAVGRYCMADDGRSAEVAFVVREDRRGLGIASTLLRALMSIARERGLVRLTAQVERDNAAMLAIFRHAGATIAEIPGTWTHEITLGLTAPRSRAGSLMPTKRGPPVS